MMSASRGPLCIGEPLLKEELPEILSKAKDWALMHGISMRSKKSFNKDQVEIAPFTLLPSAFPRSSFETVKNLQVVFNTLIHKVAHDKDFLTSALESTIKADTFTARLFDIYQTVYAEGFTQKISLGLLRSDYMLDGNKGDKIKQIEINTIASSFGGIGTVLPHYYRYILMELGQIEKSAKISLSNISSGFCEGLIRAWSMYNNEEAVILFVVEQITYNICDQRSYEFEIRKVNPKIKVIRKSLSKLAEEARLGPNKELIVGEFIVAVVYFRSGYELEAYPTEKEWAVRLLIERSQAIKCPSIQYHLAGTKKVQQVLAQPGILQRFLKEPNEIARVQEVFAGLYSLDFTEEGEKAVTMALAEPEKFVLKPQREGGGNNMYGENVRTHLKAIKNSQDRTSWILMNRIHPPIQKNYFVRAHVSDDDVNVVDVITELGIYGVVIGDHENVIYNTQVGHILRTKSANENEGGIIQGSGALDSPYFIS